MTDENGRAGRSSMMQASTGVRGGGRGGAAWRAVAFATGLSVLVILPLALDGCAGERAKPKEAPPVVRDIPDALRGTIGGESTLRGVEPQLVSGFGIVVGLNGTGGDAAIPPQVEANMERELAKGGIGRGGPLDTGPLAGKSPREVLRDPNVAIVIVEAAIPPGAPAGHAFDVRVRALPRSSVTSLEGGTLWTTPLRLGPATTVGMAQQRTLAEARGPIYINPFAEPGRTGEDAVSRTTGRILGGGKVTNPLKIELVMDNSSHARAQSMVAAINARFPNGPGDSGETARGRNGESLAIRVPKGYADKGGEFLQLLAYTRVDPSFPQEFARKYAEELKKQPGLADELSWCLEAVGKPALPFLAPLYDYPELTPRMAALRAGARLGDPRTIPYLRDLAFSGPPALRTGAIELLAEMPPNPQINLALRDLVDAPELDVRVGAYEALAKRGDPFVQRDEVSGKFAIDTVPSKDPLLYVTQQGEPRIVIFGSRGPGGSNSGGSAPGAAGTASGSGRPRAPDAGRPGLRLARPLLVSAWSDRLMLASETASTPVRLYYRDYRTDQVAQQSQAPDDVARLITYLAHKPTPEDPAPGLGLTFSETVGALYEIHRQGGIPATFATERDRLQAQLLKAADVTAIEDRPENAEEAEKGPVLVYKPQKPAGLGNPTPAGPDGKKTWVVPLNPVPDGKKGKGEARGE